MVDRANRASSIGHLNFPGLCFYSENPLGIPSVHPERVSSADFVGFNFALSMRDKDKAGKACHFFLDDYQFERIWREPERYLDALRGFDFVCSPDFSTYLNMPLALQIYNVYRARTLHAYWQENGLKVIPTLQWSDFDSLRFSLLGLPKGTDFIVSDQSVPNRTEFAEALIECERALEPERIFMYGSNHHYETDAKLVHASSFSAKFKRG